MLPPLGRSLDLASMPVGMRPAQRDLPVPLRGRRGLEAIMPTRPLLASSVPAPGPSCVPSMP
nr:hypothetical protein pFRL5_38c [Streptomyces sp. F8]